MVSAIALFVCVLGALELGRWIVRRTPVAAGSTGVGAIDGALFALLGLLVAFTFSGALERFEQRRDLIVEETNAIGTAYLRIDLLPEGARPPLRSAFRDYVDARLATYAALPDLDAAHRHDAEARRLQTRIWNLAVESTDAANKPPATMLLMPALNAMIDIVTTRQMATERHPPATVHAMLFAIAIVCALIAGFGLPATPPRGWFRMLAFAMIIAGTVYVILDLEFPRMGFIRVDAFDHALRDLRAQM